MRSHAKASSAGSTEGQGKSQGSFVRGADATRGASSDPNGSGAPSHRRARITLSLFAASLALVIMAASALASKEVATYVGGATGSGSKGGEFDGPRDSAVNASGEGPANAGDLYVADEANNRIERFDSEGHFISAWGANATHRNEVQKVVLDASSGTYSLNFEGDATDPVSSNATAETLDNALDALPSIGGDANVEVGGGNQTFMVTFTGALSGTNVPQLSADTSSLEGTAEVSTIENGSGGGGANYEICTLAGKCGQAIASGGNGTAAGNGALDHPQSVAVDEDSGNVYVSDRGNRRIDEYDGEGTFIRSFGVDVVEYDTSAFGSGDLNAALGIAAYGTSGDAYVSSGNEVHVFGPAPSRAQSGTFDGSDTDAGTFENLRRVAVAQSSGTVYAIDNRAGGAVIDKFDSSGAAQDFSALGVSSLSGADVSAPDGPVTFDLGTDSDIAVDNSGTASDGRIYVLSQFGGPATNNTAFAFAPDGTYLHKITLAGEDNACGIAVDNSGDVWISDYTSSKVVEYNASGAPTGTTIDTSAQDLPCHIAFDGSGNLYAAERAASGALYKYNSAGVFLGTIDTGPTFAVAYDPGSGRILASHSESATEYGAPVPGYQVCEGADVCKVGEAGSGVGQYGSGEPENGFGIAVSPPDGNASTGTVFLADSGNRRVDTFNLDGTSPASFGTSSNFGEEQPRSIAVDSRGIVYASDSNKAGDIQRYDSLNADGGGVGFLAPILASNDEVQKVTFTGFKTGDKFKLSCPDGTPTSDLPYGTGTVVIVGKPTVQVGAEIIQHGLEEACGVGNVSVSGNTPNATVTFIGALGSANQPQITCAKLSGTGSCSVATIADGNPGPLLRGEASRATSGLAVDPDSDGGGSDTDVLYVLRDPTKGNTVVQQLGPVQAPGLSAPPAAADDAHGNEAKLAAVRGLGLNSANAKLYVSATSEVGDLSAGHRLNVLAEGSSLAAPSVNSIGVSAHTDRSATFTASLNPNGALTGCKFQYSTDEVNWSEFGNAKGTGVLQASHELSRTEVVSVITTEGQFAVGQAITSSDGGIPINTRIGAIDNNSHHLFLTQPVTTDGPVTLTAVGRSPCSALTPNGGAQPASQTVPNLVPNTKYFYRLQVSRPFFPGLAPLTVGPQSFTTDPAAPAVSNATARAVDDSSVRLTATIDPAHSPTSYVIQYGATPSLGSSSAPISLGNGSAPIEASTVVGGLKASTTYYFRVVATNLTGSGSSTTLKTGTFATQSSFAPCPNDLLRTGPSAKLPDCRAYEQATPTDKTGSDAYGGTYSVQASLSGDGVSSYTLAGFPGSEGFQVFLTFVSRFAAGEWSTAGTLPPSSYGDFASVKAWTPDLRLAFAESKSSQNAAAPGSSLVMRDNVDGSYTVVIPQGVRFQEKGDTFALGGAFDDDSKVVFGANGEIPVSSGPAAVSSAGNAYLYDRETGDLTLVGLLPDSACASPPCIPAGGSTLPAAFGPYVQDGHVVSPSGDVYFTDSETGQLYLRRDAAGPGADTVQVSASERTDCADHDPCNGTPEPDPAGTFEPTFMGATPDGASAFFMSEQELTDEATTTSGTEDLYRFDSGAPAGQRLTDLAPGAKAVGVLGYSDGGSRVYFAANADLDGAGPAGSGNCGSSSFDPFVGSCSIYLQQADGVGTCASADGCVSFVTRIGVNGGQTDGYDWQGNAEGDPREVKASRVSADGRILVFRSERQLTSYDNQGTPEFYRYDADSGEITCLSCDPTGAPPSGEPELKTPDMYHTPSGHTSYKGFPFLSRNLSPDGERFVFHSPDKLVPADVNGDQACPKAPNVETGAGANGGPSCTDVYEWEAPGKGSCTLNSNAYSPASGGCVYLLSTGTGPYPSYIADISQSGDTVFLYNRQQLVPSDEDTLQDIYAVKVDGGLAYQHAARPASCEGDACRGASSKASDAPGAGTAVFQGPGNPKSNTNETRCPKGKRTVHAKGKVRCVAKHHKKRKSKRHHKRAANNERRASR